MAIDDTWFNKLAPLLAGHAEAFELLMPPAGRLGADREVFRASGYQIIPDLYPETTNTAVLSHTNEALTRLRQEIVVSERNEVVSALYRDKIDEAQAIIAMVLAAARHDDAAFASYNQQIYGSPDQVIYAAACQWIREEMRRITAAAPENDDMARRVQATLGDASDDDGPTPGLEPAVEVFEAVRATHFAGGADGYIGRLFGSSFADLPHTITQVQGDKLLRRAISSIGSDYSVGDSQTGLWSVLHDKQMVVRPPQFALSRPAFMGIVAHEVGSHLLEAVNGGSSQLRLLQLGLAGYEKGNEGRAFLREQIMYPDFSAYVRQPDWVPLKAGWHYRVAIQVAVGLARGLSGRPLGFREIYLFLVDLFTAWVADLRSATGQPDGQAAHDGAWNMAVRIFKGTSGAPGAVYTKDIVYLEGTVRAWQLAAKRPEFIMLGDAGKFDISSEKHVTMLSKLGILQI